MKLYYTVSSGYLNSQTNFVNSLGGYPSSTEVPNDIFDNLFDELSLLEVKDAKTQYKAIVLKNDSDKKISNVELWFDFSEENVCRYQIGAILLSEDNEYLMEQIPSTYSKPYSIQFVDATVDDKAVVGTLQPGQMIGLWLSRTIDKEKAITEYNNVAEPDPNHLSRYRAIEKQTQETVNLCLTWD